ncbi:hypothetical protein MMC18_005572 [Xylographa bjoerkii]|nr:hypothetical protein [Xylographa bjoerkii]
MRFHRSTWLSSTFYTAVAIKTASAAVTTTASPSAAPSGTVDTSCATISSLWAQASGRNLFVDAHPRTIPFDRSARRAVLANVPIVQQDALLLLDGLVPYLQFQSTLAFLKNPPQGYLLPGVDIIGGVQAIRSNVTNEVYPGEYAFQLDLWNLVNNAHDGHLIWVGDVLQSALVFQFGWNLASVSSDGNAEPSIFMLEDVLLQQGQSGLGYSPSPVVDINGQDAKMFLEALSLDNRFQDPDALYNTNFFEIAQQGLNNDESVIPAFRYPGNSTSFTFMNGTQRTYANIAVVTASFDGVIDGESFYSTFCTGPPMLPVTVPQVTLGPLQNGTPAGYPAPVIVQSGGLVGGYFMTGGGFEDVAVLSLPTFEPTPSQTSGFDFQFVIQNFLAAATAAGKTKLVIDLQANGGGLVDLAYDTFLQLFPNVVPYGASLFRAHDGLNIIGQGINNVIREVVASSPNDVTALINVFGSDSIDFAVDVMVNNNGFTSWGELFGPHAAYGDNFTSLMRLNLTNPLTALDTFPFINFTGFGSRSNFTKPPFTPENIIMLTDGFCTSSCTLFAELMKMQGNVQSYVFGGRPQTGPMQALGGSKGAQVQEFTTIMEQLALASNFSQAIITLQEENEFQQYIDTTFAGTDLANISLYVLNRTVQGRVNLKSNIRAGDASLTPLQFVYEAADCRLWYTPAMINDISEVWKAAATAAWGNSSICVANSTGDPSSLSGGANATSSGGAGRIPSPTVSAPPGPTTSKSGAAVGAVAWGSMALIVVAGMAAFL